MNLSDQKDFGCKDQWIAWAVVLTASLFFFYEFVQMNMFNSLSTSLQSAFALSPFQIGLVSAFYFLSDSLLLYPIGVGLDLYSSKKLIIIGMIMCIAGTLLISEANSSWFLVLARFLAGFASAFCLLGILRVGSQWFPVQKMGFVTGVVVTIGMLGGAVAQTPLVFLINEFGWRGALRIVALFGVVILIAIVLIVRDAPKHRCYAALQTHEGQAVIGFWKSLVLLIRNKHNWLTGTYTCCMNLPIMIIAGLFGTEWMQQAHGFSAIQGANISMMIFIGTILGSSLFGFVSDYFRSRKQPMMVGSVASFILFIGIMYLPTLSYFAYIALFFLLGLFTAAQILGYPVTQECNKPTMVSSALGFISIIIMGMPGLLQPLVGFLMGISWQGQMIDGIRLYTSHDYNQGLVILLLGFIISIFCVWVLPETYGKMQETL